MATVAIEHLTKRFGKTVAVDDLTFSLDAGTVTGLLGPNGAGKTTTLRMLLDLVRPTSGSVSLLGERYRELDNPVTRVGALLDASGFHPGRSGRNALRVTAVGAGIGDERVDEALAMVHLTAVGRKPVKRYSLGMKQRLALGCALLGDPEVLLLDEPANGLDPEGIVWLRGFLRELASAGRTVLVSSHVLAEVEQIVDRVIIMDHGRLLTQGAIADLTREAAGDVWLRAPELPRLVALLQAGGAGVWVQGPWAIVRGPTTEQIGELAHANGLALHELYGQRPSLEQLFLRLTGSRAQSADGAQAPQPAPETPAPAFPGPSDASPTTGAPS
jgi:ABC-2 type transport system ATP-binding protein